MTGQQLISLLQGLSTEDQQLPVYAEDGMDPSDPCEVKAVVVTDIAGRTSRPGKLNVIYIHA